LQKHFLFYLKEKRRKRKADNVLSNYRSKKRAAKIGYDQRRKAVTKKTRRSNISSPKNPFGIPWGEKKREGTGAGKAQFKKRKKRRKKKTVSPVHTV